MRYRAVSNAPSGIENMSIGQGRVMKKRQILGAALMLPLAVSADGVVFQPRVIGGFMDYSLDTQGGNFDAVVSSAGGEFPVNDFSLFLTNPEAVDYRRTEIRNTSAPVLGLGATVGYGQFFFDGYYQTTGTVTGAEDGYSWAGEEFGREITEKLDDLELQHYDYALSLGYSPTPNWSIFAGYKGGKTDWEQDYFYTGPVSINDEIFPSTLRTDSDGEFEQNGPFVGASYNFLVGSGALTFKVAYAYLDGDFKRTNRISGDINDEVVVKLDGNSDAFSFGVSWTQPINENLGYSLGLNLQQYEFDVKGGAGGFYLSGGEINGITVTKGEIREEIAMVNASLYYRF